MSARLTSGSAGIGRPCGTVPSSATPRSSKCNHRAATMLTMTTIRATGRCFRIVFPSRRIPSAASPSISDVGLVWPSPRKK